MYKLVFDNEGKEYYVGDLYFDILGNKEVFSFSYSNEWLSYSGTIDIDPELNLYQGRQYSKKGVFGFINDMIPDRFGKMILDDNEIKTSIRENRLPRKLLTSDYLLLVNDATRMGALRIKDENNNYLNNDIEHSVPPYVYLRDIEEASFYFEQNGTFDKKEYQRLLMPGSSLGGARPKANIYYNDELWIAKFPSINDKYDMELWEKVALDLAKMCEIDVPESRLEKYSDLGSTLLISRFDRNGNERHYYISFVTALNAFDGDSGSYSYLNIASYIRSSLDNVSNNLLEIYKRLIFNYIINNTDNHLRNNGLLYKNDKMNLSPFFDVNPSFFVGDFALPLVKNKEANKSNIIADSKYYGLDENDAIALYDHISKVIETNIESLAHKYGAKNKEIELIKNIIKTRI